MNDSAISKLGYEVAANLLCDTIRNDKAETRLMSQPASPSECNCRCAGDAILTCSATKDGHDKAITSQYSRTIITT